MKYSIVIPTYNNCDKFLKPCIEALLKYSHINDIELIISANGCTDNTSDYLDKLKASFDYLGLSDHLKIVWNKDALGYARATNAGIRVSTCDKLVMLNMRNNLLTKEVLTYY
jgi:glycosyltransferase involved in cell wall biosynthesis